MERVAIPIFESRVSPVLDSCSRLLCIDLEEGIEMRREEIAVQKLSVYERLDMLCRWGIKTVICAGISELMCSLLKSRNIESVSGVVGEVEKIINAYCCGNLDDPCFCMPGKRPDNTT
jgi:predicted Fe-Mo cluster-binding NifX family protein